MGDVWNLKYLEDPDTGSPNYRHHLKFGRAGLELYYSHHQDRTNLQNLWE